MNESATPAAPQGGGALLAGLAIAGLLVPEAVAYAAIAGVPPAHALAAALAGLLVYPFIGTSRFATLSATSSAAAIFASVVTANGAASAFALVGITGGLFVIAALARAHFLAAFVSRPVLRGFAWALAATIVIKQLPGLTGVPASSAHTLPLLWEWLGRLPALHGAATALGAGALALWLALHRLQARHAWVQPSVLVLALGIGLSATLPLTAQGVALVGPVTLQGLRLGWPQLDWDSWVRALQVAPALLMILFAESWGSARSLALQAGDPIDARREMLALGAANIGSSMLQGLPVGAGFSASSANYEAGGRSRWTGLVAAAAIALLLGLAQDALALLPLPVLCAVVAGIVSHKLGPRPLWATLRWNGDAWMALAAAAGVLALGVLFGMLLAVGLSLLLALRRFAQPASSELGRLPGTRDFVALRLHPQAGRTPGVLVLRPDEPLFFANAEAMAHTVAARASAPGLHAVVLSVESSDDMDVTTLEAVQELHAHLARRGVALLLARVKDHPRAALQRAGLAHIATFWSVDDAVCAAQAPAIPEQPAAK